MNKDIKAVILAAGEGRRLRKYAKDLPKGMLKFAGKPLIEHQINLFRKEMIGEIIVIKGYAQEKIGFSNVNYYINQDFEKTNMVASLFCAEEALRGEIIVSYADIIFDMDLLSALIKSKHDIVVCVDTNWQKYWHMRYGSIKVDTESLKIDGDLIISLGRKNPSTNEIDGRYVGLMKFSAIGIEQLKSVWHNFKDDFWNKPWQVSGKPLSKAFMTDIIQALIDEGHKVHALKTNNDWIEFDTDQDYEKAIKWFRDGTLNSLIDIDV